MAYTAATALPYKHLERATAALRAELRQQLLASDFQEPPDWRHLTITGPVEAQDGLGRSWHWYRATLDVATVKE